MYVIIIILIIIRMLLLKRFSPSAFAIIDTFMDHDADRQKVYSSPKSPLTSIIIINVIHE